jgi:predicted TIM-barrel fold metal-dependent hydrolase
MTVVDVDTHWEVERFARGEHPFEQWRARFPSRVDHLANGLAGDVLRALPDERRPDGNTVLRFLVEDAERRGEPASFQPFHPSSPAERVAWMDEIGIDHCLVNPGTWWQLLEYLGPERPAGAARCNDYMAEQLADCTDRLHGVAVIDFADLGVAVAELERARALGNRAFFLYTVDGRPPRPTPPGHPEWDVVWSAAVALGMVAVIHVGNTYADFSGWADIGWDQPGGLGPTALLRLASSRRAAVAQDLLFSMLYGGVFHRYPTLTVMLEEMGVGWLPSFVDHAERLSRSGPAMGEWPLELSGGEMIRRNVRFTPLPGYAEADAIGVVGALPDMALFSSDYPHGEGNADPINAYGDALGRLDDETRARFLGGNAVDAFSRMGDPL